MIVHGHMDTWTLSSQHEVLNQKCACEGLSKNSSYFSLHLIKVGDLKRFKQEMSDLQTILPSDLRFLGLRQAVQTCQSCVSTFVCNAF